MLVYLLPLFIVFASTAAAQATPVAHKATPAKATDTKAGGLIVTQFCGGREKFTSRVTPAGVRIDSDGHEYYLLCHAPDWKVYIVNNERREMAVVSHQDWCTKFQLRPLSWVSSLGPPLRAVTEIVDGHKQVIYYFGPTEHMSSVVTMRSNLKIPDIEVGGNHAEIVCLEYPGAKMTGPVMSRFRGLPPLPGIMLTARRYIGNRKNNHFNGAIDCVGTQFNQTIDDSIFTPPKNYKIVPFFAGLAETNSLKGDASDLIKGLMLDSK